MASPTVTLKLKRRSLKGPTFSRLPASISIPPTSTVDDVKQLVARAAGLGDANRIGLCDPTTGKTLKDRKARVVPADSTEDDAYEVLVKDLGPQVAWRTVFLVEYLGPILIHAAVVLARPMVFPAAAAARRPMSSTQWLAFAMIMAHFAKRELETLFVHKFSAATMPRFNIVKNSAFYWLLAGLLCALFIYNPRSYAATANIPVVDALGAAIYLFGETGNALVHLHLSSLRSRGGTERKIPSGYGFALVTCPNYMYEVLSWAGVIVVSRDWAVALFIAIGAAQMYAWARVKERSYRREFGDKYKKKRYVMLPGLL